MKIALRTSKGRRDNNADRGVFIDASGMLSIIGGDDGGFHCVTEDSFFVAVCDGIGKTGAKAAQKAVECIVDNAENYMQIAEPNAMEEFMEVIHDRVRSSADNGQGSGTTIAEIHINTDSDEILVASVGDSSVFCINRNDVKKITTDHTLDMLYEEYGICFQEPSCTLTRYVGQKNSFSADVFSIPKPEKGDAMILCTDGASRAVSNLEMELIATKYNAAEELADCIHEQAIINGSRDNITVAVVLF